MSTILDSLSRRRLFAGGAALAGSLVLPKLALAQADGPIKIGALAPLTGAGGTDGPSMVAANKAVIDAVNAAGGVLGRQIQLVVEDDQTTPDAGVRATQKLIQVDGVSAIIDIWASSVAAAVLPICWQAKVMAFGVAANDALADLPHQGYFLRTQPTSGAQAQQYAKFAVDHAVKHIFLMMPQQPFSPLMIQLVQQFCEPKGVKVSSLTYDPRQTSFRSEVDQVMASGADMIYMGGYVPEDIVLTKEIYRASYSGIVAGTATGITPQLIAAVGNDVVENCYTIVPVPAFDSNAYKKVSALMGGGEVNTIVCQAYDQTNLLILAIAAAKATDGTSIRDNVRKISNSQGTAVDNAIDGIKLLAQGQSVKYSGASGPCVFKDNGDPAESVFELRQIKGGKFIKI